MNTTAFIPFAAGPRICAGMALAMNEMRVVVSFVVQRFDMKIAAGYDLNQWEKDLKPYITFEKGKLPVVLSERGR